MCTTTTTSTGIGYETAKVLCGKGYDVTIACRDEQRAKNAVASLKAADASAQVSYILMDLANLQTVRDAAAAWLDSGKQIDVLLNNAGEQTGARSSTITTSSCKANSGSHCQLACLLPCLLPCWVVGWLACYNTVVLSPGTSNTSQPTHKETTITTSGYTPPCSMCRTQQHLLYHLVHVILPTDGATTTTIISPGS